MQGERTELAGDGLGGDGALASRPVATSQGFQSDYRGVRPQGKIRYCWTDDGPEPGSWQ